MFVFYFGIFANITPPVALAAFAGAGTSGGNPMLTGFQALKLSLAGFIIPYMFVYNPAMLMIDATDIAVNATECNLPPIMSIIIIILTSIVGIIALSAAIEVFFKTKMNIIQRLILGGGAILSIAPETFSDIIGISIIAVIFGLNYMTYKREIPVATS